MTGPPQDFQAAGCCEDAEITKLIAETQVVRKKYNSTAETQRTAEDRRERQNTKTHKLMEITHLFRERPQCCDFRFNIIQE